jgi:hypothetical protein
LKTYNQLRRAHQSQGKSKNVTSTDQNYVAAQNTAVIELNQNLYNNGLIQQLVTHPNGII